MKSIAVIDIANEKVDFFAINFVPYGYALVNGVDRIGKLGDDRREN